MHALADKECPLGGIDAPNLRVLALPELDLEHVQAAKLRPRHDLLGDGVHVGEALHETDLTPRVVCLCQYGQLLGFCRGVGRRLFRVHGQAAPEHHRRKLVLLWRRADGEHAVEFFSIEHFVHVGIDAARTEVAGIALRFLLIDVAHGNEIYLRQERNLRKNRGGGKMSHNR